MDVIVWDTECFPNCFMLCANDGSYFEISKDRNDIAKLREWVLTLKNKNSRMVGFNNVGFDYPVLHFILTSGISDPKTIYDYAMTVIQSENKFGFTVKPSDCWVPQIDLFKIHHFDNKSRTTSLKALEFNMRMDNISDLPFPVGTVLNSHQIGILKDYCFDDVDATVLFYKETIEQIAFREQLSKKYSRDFMNYSDVKIGKEIFQISLEVAGVPCYSFGSNGRTPRQTPRQSIDLGMCVPSFVAFERPEFNKILNHFKSTVITETKGAFKDLSVTVDGLEFVFGTGGIHASVENESFETDTEMMIYDVDVTSLYPSIAITNGYFPEHLTSKFVEVYAALREQRVAYKKGTAENAMLKLALNGVYGASNDKFSVFYDPLFTMKITVGGQLMLAMLAEQLMKVHGVRIIQVNTDGITLHMPRTSKFLVDGICHQWEQLTKLNLESVEYSHMAIADVNSYIAEKYSLSELRKIEFNIGLFLYPACRWCNQTLGAKELFTYEERLLFLYHKLHEKLDMCTLWSNEEIEELDGELKRMIKARQIQIRREYLMRLRGVEINIARIDT